MVFMHDLYFTVREGAYHVFSKKLEFTTTEPAIATTAQKKGEQEELLLDVGADEKKFRSDPDYHRIIQEYNIRFYDPFSKKNFQPNMADSVLSHYSKKAIDEKRKKINKKLRFLLWLFVDKFNVALEIPHYSGILDEQRRKFEKLLSENSHFYRFEIR